MNSYKKYLIPSLSIIAAVALTGCNQETPVEKTEVDLSKIDIFEQPAKPAPGAVSASDVRVSVNGTDITIGQIMQLANQQLQQVAQQVPAEQLPAIQQQIMKQAEDGVIMQAVLNDAAKAAGITATPADVDAAIEEIKGQLPPNVTIEQMLTQRGMTIEQFKATISEQMPVQKLMEGSTKDVVEATDEEVAAFYAENTQQFVRPETVRASHILIKTEATDTDEVKAEAKAKAEAIAVQAQAEGADFAALAKENSACPSSANGGDLDFFEKGQMVPEFSAAAYSMNVGDVSGVVETQFGFHIIKVTDKKAGETVALEEAAPRIKQHLTQQKKQEAMRAFAEDLRSKATIKYTDAAE